MGMHGGHWDPLRARLKEGLSTADGEWPGVMPPGIAGFRTFLRIRAQNQKANSKASKASENYLNVKALEAVYLNVDFHGEIRAFLENKVKL